MSVPQSAVRLQASLMQVIATDADVIALAADQMGGELTIIEGNTLLEQLKSDELPALVGEVGDGENELTVVGNSNSEPGSDFPICFIWRDPDRSNAFQTRLKLIDVTIRALMRNVGLDLADGNGAAADWAYITGWMSSKGNQALHPMQWMQFNARCGYQLEA